MEDELEDSADTSQENEEVNPLNRSCPELVHCIEKEVIEKLKTQISDLQAKLSTSERVFQKSLAENYSLKKEIEVYK